MSSSLGRPDLVDLLRRRILQNGPLTFAQFMAAALYEPGLGYYTSPSTRGAESHALADFQTSSQVHPAFGWLVARELATIWEILERPAPFLVAELGAGAGELARQIRDGLAEAAPGCALEYHAVDLRAGARHKQEPSKEARSCSLSQGERVRVRAESPTWWPNLDSLAEARVEVHCVLSNEFFDALPVHRVAWIGGALREVYVDWAGAGFVERLGEPSDPSLAEWLDQGEIAPTEGWRGEICLDLESTLAAIAKLIRRGVVLTIDYGYDSEFASPSKDSLLAYHRHQWNDEAYQRVGEQDLTCHVDFAAFLRIGRAHGLEPAGATTQHEFLLRLSLAEEAERWAQRESTPARQWQARFALAELVRPDELGRLNVVAQQKSVPAYRLRASI